MNPHISILTPGVSDVGRAKQFYGEGLGWPIEVDQGYFAAFRPSEGSSSVALYPRDALAADGGVPADGSGFRAFTLSDVVRSEDRVDAVLAEAERAGARIVKPAQRAQWGGYYGYFADPDGNLWKVVAGAGEQPFAE